MSGPTVPRPTSLTAAGHARAAFAARVMRVSYDQGEDRSVPAPDPWFRPPNDMERAILDRTARGDTRAEIGRRIHLTPTGVGWHLERLRRLWRLRTIRQVLV